MIMRTALVAMVDTNLQRESILQSEKAKAYSMKFAALKHQGVKGENEIRMMKLARSRVRVVKQYSVI